MISLALLVLSFACVGGPFETAADRPNIVLILADDLGWGDVGFNGRVEWATPNLDRLASQGTTFNRWYTAAVVCAPSRAALLTGRSTIHCGVSRNNEDLPSSEVTIAEALKSQGYATAIFGKWHHGAFKPPATNYVHPMDQGFDEFFGFTDAKHAWEKHPNELWEGRELKPFEGWANDRFAERSVDFIKRRKAAPFFLYLAFTDPHFDVEAPPEEFRKYEKAFARPVDAHYAAMVSRLDRNVGVVLKALDDLALSENTLVVFVSDHGATFEAGNKGSSVFHDSNRPFRGQKRTLWEGGIRVPAVVRWPGRVPSGVVSNSNMHNIDVFPTLLAAASPAGPKAPAPLGSTAPKVDGRDMLGVWEGKAKAPDRTLFWEWRSEGTLQIAAMQGDLKLVRTGGNPPELFNVANDPAERRNIAALHPKNVKDLDGELRAWLATERKTD